MYSFLALTIALGTGGAYAANTVFSTDIVDGAAQASIATGIDTVAKDQSSLDRPDEAARAPRDREAPNDRATAGLS